MVFEQYSFSSKRESTRSKSAKNIAIIILKFVHYGFYITVIGDADGVANSVDSIKLCRI